jgi:membrane-bound lytic murein transglycosylase B
MTKAERYLKRHGWRLARQVKHGARWVKDNMTIQISHSPKDGRDRPLRWLLKEIEKQERKCCTQ